MPDYDDSVSLIGTHAEYKILKWNNIVTGSTGSRGRDMATSLQTQHNQFASFYNIEVSTYDVL